jgi:hypothetical protein
VQRGENRHESALVLDPEIILWQDFGIHKTLHGKHMSYSLTDAMAERPHGKNENPVD